jgi:hypothetical protein
MSAGTDPYQDRCTVRVRVYLRSNGRQGRIDGPPPPASTTSKNCGCARTSTTTSSWWGFTT